MAKLTANTLANRLKAGDFPSRSELAGRIPTDKILNDLEPELRDPTRFGLAMATVNVALFSLMSLAQWIGWGGLYAVWEFHGQLLREALAVTLVNFMFGMLVVVGVFVLRPMQFRARVRYPLIALTAAVAAAPRVLAMMAIYTTPSSTPFLVAEWVSGFLAGSIAVGAAVLTAGLVGRARREHQRWVDAAQLAQRASDELHTEEMRVRRMVADQLHGRLQYRLVTIAAGLDAQGATFAADGRPQCASSMRDFADQIDQIREQEVRALSHAVYPAGIELGAVSAIQAMLHRLPPQIATSVTFGDKLTEVLEAGVAVMPLAERLIAVFTIEEAITNALKHGQAKSLAINLEFREGSAPGQLVLEARLDDDGRGLESTPAEVEPVVASGRLKTVTAPVAQVVASGNDADAHTGLARHAERLSNRGGHLTLASAPTGGTRLEFSLPFNSLLPTEDLELAS